jgi:hypothetical protein
VAASPIRGTQSFVAIMGQVWRRPSLAAREIAWRWLVGSLFLIPLWIHSGADLVSRWDEFRSEAIMAFHGAFIYEVQWARLIASVLTLALIWNLTAAIGRTLVLRRLDTTLHPRRFTLLTLSTLRALCLAAAWCIWLRFVTYATHTTITAPAARHEDPSLVLFSAMLICGSILLYVLWGIFSWFLYLAPLLAMQRNLGTIASLRAALASRRDLRSKLIEINLVMNIVRIALIVLAMVLSASPLAFQTVATQQFFAIWWAVAILLYLAASDYFHVVRSAAYISLYRAYNFAPAS